YPYTQLDWEDDFRQMQQNGVDAVALNIGSDSWQLNQLHLAYSAAQSLPTNNNSFRLFLSFDFTAMPCSIDYVVNLVNQFAQHPSQFKVRGRPMVSSYSGDCLGNKGWADVKRRTNGYLMPFIWGLEDKFQEWDSLDSWYCWGCAWPQGNSDKTTNDDDYYFSQLGSRYATTVSVWLYTHYGYKNFLQRSDDWLINSRWEQLIAMRDQLTFVEMVTWNDYGESDYFGPIKGSQPDGTTWANGFPHTAWFEMSKYYITAFKTGQYPPITEDVIYFWARPHPAAAIAVADRLGKPSGHDWTSDYLWAVVFATSTSTITLQSGVSSQTFNNVPAGVTKLKIPLASGKVAVTMFRNAQKVIDHREDNFEFGATPFLYNYNAYVGSAIASHTTASLPSSPSSAIPTSPISITIAETAKWVSTGCLKDSRDRILRGSFTAQAGMTSDRCIDICNSQNYTIAATEYGSQCYCGSQLYKTGDAGTIADTASCNMSCGGDSSQICGGSWHASVFVSNPDLKLLRQRVRRGQRLDSHSWNS
ncbi:glycoside hydrolase family 71 protein, partial [Amanita thiersii Skay4041]